jgi:hypothetical protein
MKVILSAQAWLLPFSHNEIVEKSTVMLLFMTGSLQDWNPPSIKSFLKFCVMLFGLSFVVTPIE